MKGIILAAGRGTRLAPLTDFIPKCLLPVRGKPLAQHSVEAMVRAGIRDICLVVRPDQASQFALAFGDGSRLGCDLTLTFQSTAGGIADAMKAARSWSQSGDDDGDVMVLLGDTIYGHAFRQDAKSFDFKVHYAATIYAAYAEDPSWCAQLERDNSLEVLNIHEKPSLLVSHEVVPGCYLYTSDVWERIDHLIPSERGELEITDLNLSYLRDGLLEVISYVGEWTDAGTDMAAYQAAQHEPPGTDR